MNYSDIIYSVYKFIHDNVEVPYSIHVNYNDVLDEHLLDGSVEELVQVFFMSLISPYQTVNPGSNVRLGVYTSAAKDPTRRNIYKLVDKVRNAIGSIANVPFYDFSNVETATDEPVDTGKTIPLVWMETIPVALTSGLNYNIIYVDYKLFVSELCLELDTETSTVTIGSGIGENIHG